MQNTQDCDRPEKITTAVVIGILDIIAILVIIAILCTKDFRF